VFDAFIQWIAEALGASPELIKKIAASLGIFAVYAIGRRFIANLIGRGVDDGAARYRFTKAGQLLLLGVALIVLARVWFQGATGVGTWLGLLSAGVAVALQDPLENLAGWVYIVISRPFRVGDRIQIDSHAGDVVDIHPFSFTLLEIGNWVDADQSTGRLIHIPNGWLFKHAIAGYDHGFPYIWNEIAVTVTFESEWRKAKALLEQILAEQAQVIEKEEFDRASDVMHIEYARVTPVVWTDTVPEGIRLTMRYLCPPRRRRVSASLMWESILEVIGNTPDVDFAYPTTRRFDHAVEGKAKLRSNVAPRPLAGREPPAQPGAVEPADKSE